MNIIDLNTPTSIKTAINILQNGGLVVYPTETCYGIGADATNQSAIDKLLKFKTKREGKAFSVAVVDQNMAEKYVELNSTAVNLYQNFLPGPLTVVSKIKLNSSVIAKGVESEFHTLGIRIPEYKFVLDLVNEFGKPITATSANISYQSPPYSLQQWSKQTPKKSQQLVDLWIDAGKLPLRQPSTVVDTTLDELTVLRQGNLEFKTKSQNITYDEHQTQQLGKSFIKSKIKDIEKYGLIIGLQGQLGAGKTQFAKGIAEGLEIKDQIKSPTFTLVHEYSFYFNNKNSYFYHIDTWRMESAKELLNIGFQDMLKPGNIVIVEWAEKVSQVLKSESKDFKTKLIWGNCEVIDQQVRKWSFSD